MKTYDDIQVEGHLRVLIWAPPGSGKTALAATFPGTAFIDFDNGLKVLKSKWFKQWNRGKPGLVGYETFDDKYDSRGIFLKAQGLWDAIKFINRVADDPQVKTIVVDSLTSFQTLAMHAGTEAAGNVSPKPRSNTLANARGNVKALLYTQADFGAEMGIFEQFMNQFIGIEKNLVCIAHEREVISSSGGVQRREPYLIGSSIRAQVAKWFDEVWYLDVDSKGKRRLITEYSGLMKVNKSRLGVPNKLEDPNYKKILQEIS